MNEREPKQDDGQAWKTHAEAQQRAWLALSATDRLRWLSQAKTFARKAAAARRTYADEPPRE